MPSTVTNLIGRDQISILPYLDDVSSFKVTHLRKDTTEQGLVKCRLLYRISSVQNNKKKAVRRPLTLYRHVFFPNKRKHERKLSSKITKASPPAHLNLFLKIFHVGCHTFKFWWISGFECRLVISKICLTLLVNKKNSGYYFVGLAWKSAQGRVCLIYLTWPMLLKIPRDSSMT